MTTTAPTITWQRRDEENPALALEDLREKIVEHARRRDLLFIRYRWKEDAFLPLVIGKVCAVQTQHLAIAMSKRGEHRFIPFSAIVSVAMVEEDGS